MVRSDITWHSWTSTAATDNTWQIWSDTVTEGTTISRTNGTWTTDVNAFTWEPIYGSAITLSGSDSNTYVYGNWVEEKREEKTKNKRENKALHRRERVERERQRVEEERRERERQEELRRYDAKIKATKAAEKKAHKLLSDNLNKEQLESLEKNGYFRIKSQSGKHYEINKDDNYNVVSLDRFRKRKKQHCALPKGNVPHYDTMLAQKLMLEHKEEDFLKVANVRTG